MIEHISVRRAEIDIRCLSLEIEGKRAARRFLSLLNWCYLTRQAALGLMGARSFTGYMRDKFLTSRGENYDRRYNRKL